MIQKFQTYFTRFINYLENNSDTRLFKTYLKNNEDLELKKIYMQVNHLNGLLRSYLDKISEINLNYERAINQGYSHLKRKQQILKLPHSQLKEVIGRELGIYCSQDAINVATRLLKILEQIKRKPHESQYRIILEDAKSLSDIVLSMHRDIPTIESSLRTTEE
jgi:hypothetical protein